MICFDRFEDFGLIDCFKPHTDCVQTLRHARSSIPWQNDYIFVSRALAGALQSCVVLDAGHDERIERFSDHNPVVVELQLPDSAWRSSTTGPQDD